jgi:hypothetical protein
MKSLRNGTDVMGVPIDRDTRARGFSPRAANP